LLSFSVMSLEFTPIFWSDHHHEAVSFISQPKSLASPYPLLPDLNLTKLQLSYYIAD
jgi:hypothetical protein